MTHRTTYDSQGSGRGEEIPRTKRPALLHHVPASHSMQLRKGHSDEDARKGPAGFLLHLFGYLLGTKLQFDGWRLDSRVPIKSTHQIYLTPETAESFLGHSYESYLGWPGPEQALMTNLLFMHCRVPSYEWDWERFMVEFTVLDACYNLASKVHLVASSSHRLRAKAMCDYFEIPLEEAVASDILRLRNALFHEDLWYESQPGSPIADGIFITLHLRALNQRLIPALLGYHNDYIHTPWWTGGGFEFGEAR